MNNETVTRKTHLIKFSQRKVFNDTSITKYSQPLKVTQSVKFLRVIIDSHLNMKLHVNYIEGAYLECYKTKYNQCCPINPPLQNYYKILNGLCLHSPYCARKSQRHGLEVIESLSCKKIR